eukprot:955554-Pleurochrysis_carterae.AAC.2
MSYSIGLLGSGDSYSDLAFMPVAEDGAVTNDDDFIFLFSCGYVLDIEAQKIRSPLFTGLNAHAIKGLNAYSPRN